MNVLWFGFGKFGLPMAQKLMDSGHKVFFPEEFRESPTVRSAFRSGVSNYKTTRHIDILALCLPKGRDSEQVIRHLISKSVLPQIILDFGTVAPGESQQLATLARTNGSQYVDCPISGDIEKARHGKLTIYAGCPEAEQVSVVLNDLGENIFYFDTQSLGACAKHINQYLHLSNLALVGQAFAVAGSLGLELPKLYEALMRSSSYSNMLERFGPDYINNDFDCRFSISNARKDAGQVISMLQEQNVTDPIFEHVHKKLMDSALNDVTNMNFSLAFLKSLDRE